MYATEPNAGLASNTSARKFASILYLLWQANAITPAGGFAPLDDTHQIRCAESWGVVEALDLVSVCGGDQLTRIAIADLQGRAGLSEGNGAISVYFGLEPCLGYRLFDYIHLAAENAGQPDLKVAQPTEILESGSREVLCERRPAGNGPVDEPEGRRVS